MTGKILDIRPGLAILRGSLKAGEGRPGGGRGGTDMEKIGRQSARGNRTGAVCLAVFCALLISRLSGGQEPGNLSRDFEPEILKAMSRGNISSAAVALVR